MGTLSSQQVAVMSDAPGAASLIGSHCPEPCNIVIFGASGDLAKRKLLPALAHMHLWNLIGSQSKIIGVVREDWSRSHWVNYVHDQLLRFFPDAVLNPSAWREISDRLDMVHGELGDAALYAELKTKLRTTDGKSNAIFYLAIPPDWHETVAIQLRDHGMADESEGFRRVVVEKPFGTCLKSAQDLNVKFLRNFKESQIYRIDHYLGKESVQNLMVFRFANSVFEPMWNRNYIDHVQISVSESLGVEYRALYYDKAGALRDMIQSHLLQVMSLVAMESPVSLDAQAIRDEKLKVLRAVRQIQPDEVESSAVRAQYTTGMLDGEKSAGYRDEPMVDPASTTETFAAVKIFVDNWRWHDVPFLLRTGKKLPARVSEITIRFRKPPQNLFAHYNADVPCNELIFRLHPDEGMIYTINAKKPGLAPELRKLPLDAPYSVPGSGTPEAYETLLHDVLLGEATLFSSGLEVEESWRIVQPILDAWQQKRDVQFYSAGSWDVPGMDRLIEGCEGGWRDLCAGANHEFNSIS
ncbi:MAG: glucose-6-phosphate dehydrogenase [Mariprofundales bacterium]|nr:glucose-6-phosphate dehydrogenase [Mariprofundales bacterium]